MIDTATLEDGIRQWLARIGELAEPAEDGETFDQRRARERRLSDALADEFAQPVDPRAVSDDITFATGWRARRHRPADARGPLPTQVFLHGGGFVSGSPFETLNDAILSERSAAATVQIIALQYPLAPEHPYPAAVEATLSVLRELVEEPSWLAVEDRIGVGGGSAGGQIGAVAALRSRDGDGPPVVHQLLEVPAISWRPDWDSVRDFASPQEVHGAQSILAAYSGNAPTDEYFEPLSATDVSGVAPATILTAEFDPLRDGAEAYAHALQLAGVPVTLHRVRGQLHGTTGLTAAVASARQWQRLAVDALRAAYGGPAR